MKLEYPFTISEDQDGWLVVQFLDFDEAFTQGKTVEECYFNAQEVLSLVIEQRMADGLEIPLPGDPDAPHRTTPDARIQAALLVHLARGNRSLADLARALGTSWPSVQRLEDPRHSSTLHQIERAAAALGKRLVLSFEDSSPE
jgi:antitoxin HicB